MVVESSERVRCLFNLSTDTKIGVYKLHFSLIGADQQFVAAKEILVAHQAAITYIDPRMVYSSRQGDKITLTETTLSIHGLWPDLRN